jgi:hypothetical protein
MLGLETNNLAKKDGKNLGEDMQLQSHNHSWGHVRELI